MAIPPYRWPTSPGNVPYSFLNFKILESLIMAISPRRDNQPRKRVYLHIYISTCASQVSRDSTPTFITGEFNLKSIQGIWCKVIVEFIVLHDVLMSFRHICRFHFHATWLYGYTKNGSRQNIAQLWILKISFRNFVSSLLSTHYRAILLTDSFDLTKAQSL